jgi:hypothetical protein
VEIACCFLRRVLTTLATFSYIVQLEKYRALHMKLEDRQHLES